MKWHDFTRCGELEVLNEHDFSRAAKWLNEVWALAPAQRNARKFRLPSRFTRHRLASRRPKNTLKSFSQSLQSIS